jgi:hypothetical protein
MSEKNNDKWLEKIISETINTGKPQFNPEEFKQKFPDELEILRSRTSRPPQKLFSLKSIFNDPFSSFATAAVIILSIGLFMFFSFPKDNTKPHKVQDVEKSPAEMLSTMSLIVTYRQGGIEAMEKQMDEAIQKLEPSTSNVTIEELLKSFNSL